MTVRGILIMEAGGNLNYCLVSEAVLKAIFHNFVLIVNVPSILKFKAD